MFTLLSKLSLATLDNVVLNYIKKNPGSRLFEIDRDTLKSHHSWGTKHIVERLESKNRVTVIRYKWGKKIAPKYYALH